MNYIYGLFCPVASVIRYIGKSVNPQDRFLGHITVAKTAHGRHHTARWIRKLLTAGLLPELRILEEVPQGKSWKAAERRWIAEARAKGWPLTNTTDGGDAFPELSKEIRKAMAPKIAAGVRKAWADPEIRRRWLVALNTPEAKRNHAEAMREVLQRPETREAISASLSAIWSTPERKAFASKRAKAMLANSEQNGRRIAAICAAVRRPDVKARLAVAMTDVFSRPEVKAKMAAKAAASWKNSAYRAKVLTPERNAKVAAKLSAYWAQNPDLMSKRMNDPARTAKISAAMIRRNADPAFRAKVDAPEVRARQAATLRATWARRKAEQNI